MAPQVYLSRSDKILNTQRLCRLLNTAAPPHTCAIGASPAAISPTMTRQQTIKLISHRLKEIPEAESWLFGSSARGDFHTDSDIDLLILLPDKLSSKERIELQQKITEILWPIEMESGLDISPVILQYKTWTQRTTPFTLNVLNDRIPL